MSDIEFVLAKCKTIETLLVESFGATGRGLHEKISSVEHLLSPRIVQQGRYIATIRNKIVHDANYPRLDDRDRFIQACNEVETALRNYQPGSQSNFHPEQQSNSSNFTNISVDVNSYFGTSGEPIPSFRNFVFSIEKNERGIKISTRKTRAILVIVQKTLIAIIIAIVIIAFVGSSPKVNSSLTFAIALIIVVFGVLIQIKKSLINTTISPDSIYVNGRKYEKRKETFFYIYSLNMDRLFSWEVYFIAPNQKVYIAQQLTRAEAEELLKILCKADLLYTEPRVSFLMKRRDSLIFLSSTKTNTSFVMNYEPRLWQSLGCRIKQKGKIELSKSELTELYERRLETLS